MALGMGLSLDKEEKAQSISQMERGEEEMTKESTPSQFLEKLGNFVANIRDLAFSYDEVGWEFANKLEMELYKKSAEMKKK